MPFYRLLALSLVLASSAAAQVTVSGVVQDSTEAPLPGATVVLLTPADSVLVSFAASRSDGAFQLRNVREGEYLLRVTFVGYETASVPVTVQTEDLDVGTVRLATADGDLGRLVVETDRVPVILRGDTLDYDAAAFGTPQGAVVEDLLRRLPGVEVEDDGTIRAQGETVENVLVDGKEFFTGDPTVATRNLPADAVDRVQVFDQQSETAEFTGVDDGEEERTINLELKEDRRTGAFGNVSGGFGGVPGTTGTGPATADPLLFDSQASINRFSPSTQASLIANLNNINRETFSIRDYFQFMGPTAMRGGGMVFRLDGNDVPIGDDPGDGFATTLSGGLNFNHDLGTKTKLRSSYFLYRLDKERVREVQREQFFGEGLSSLLAEDGSNEDLRTLHRLSFRAEHEFADGHDLSVVSALRYAGSDQGEEANRQTTGLSGGLENARATTTTEAGVDAGGDANLTYRRRFASRRSIVAEAGVEGGIRDVDGGLDATTRLFTNGDLLTTEEIAQVETLNGDQRTLSGSLLFTQPLSHTDALQFRTEARIVGEDQTRDVRDRLGAEPVLIDSLSSAFDRTYRYAIGGVTYRRNREPLSLSAGLRLQVTDLDGRLSDVEPTIGSQFVRFLPSATISYAISDSRNAEIGYETSTREPTLRELQPVADVRDPLSVYVGNPDLLPVYTHSINARYLSFDAFTSTNLFGFARASYSPTAISTERTVDQNLRQTSRPINTAGTWTVNGNASLGTLVRRLRSRVNGSVNTLFNRAVEVVNGEDNVSQLLRMTLDVRIQNQDTERISARAGAQFSYNANAYSLNRELNRRFLNRSFYADLGWTPTEAWELRTRFDLDLFDDAVVGGSGGVRSVPLWEASLSRTLMGGKTRVEVVAKDLLDRNLGVDFSSTASYVQESRVNTLGRYVLLRLVYNLGSSSGRGGVFG